MKPDKPLIKHTLATLARIGPAGLEEDALMTEVEIASGRLCTSQEIRDVLIFATDRGWIASRRDDFDRTIRWLTDAGKTTLAGM